MKGRIFLKALAAFAAVIVTMAFSTYFAARNHSYEINDIKGALLRGALLALLIAGVLAALIAKTVSARFQRIVSFAEQLSKGDLQARIGEDQDGEIAQVAATLDRSARRLEESFTALKESRAQLEVFLNSMNDGVIAVSPDLKVLWANHVMADLVRHPVRVGTPVIELVRHPDFLNALQTVLATGRRESAIVPALLGMKAFSVTVEPLPDGGAVSVLHDISEIERVEKTRRDFIANVSHELRTPLTSIRGYAETLLDSEEPVNGNTREFLQIIRRNAERMGRLTEDLLVLARVESGEEKLDLQPCLPKRMLEESATAFQESARSADVQVSIDPAPDVPVMADSYAIQQVLANLISNALRYAQNGKSIVLGAKEQRTHVEFFVRDAGPGIPSEHLPRIFERFYRVDKARSRETGGTGLGLAIVKHIVLNHGGTVRVESAIGHGSTFFFTLTKG
jgi:two-component system phosphate regulon sensor histidine kinase PhoR